MTRKEAIDFVANMPQNIVVISYANYNGSFDCCIEAARENYDDLPAFSYVEWEGDHQSFIRDRNKVLNIWGNEITTTISEIVERGNF